MTAYYNGARLRQGLLHFLTGKMFTAVSTIAVVLLLARVLSKEDFGALILFEAILAIVGVLSSFGVNQTVLRFLPELRSQGNAYAAYRLVWRTLMMRACIVALALSAVGVCARPVVSFFGVPAYAELLRLFLLGGWFSLLWFLMVQIMETLMWQRSSQYSIAFTAMLRLSLILFSHAHGEVDLQRIIYIEIFCHILTLLLLIGGFMRCYYRDSARTERRGDWFAENRLRVRRYAIGGYGVALSTLLYGSQPNRAVGARHLGPTGLGEYGFADSLANLFRRFLPTALLQGFIRPVYFARYAESGDLMHLERMANLVFRINLLAVAGGVLITLMFGGPLIDYLTADKYGGTIYLIAGMLGVIVLESLQQQHGLLCQTLERTSLLTASNLVLSGSLLLALPLFTVVGPWAIVFANAVGNLAALALVRRTLGRAGQGIALDGKLIARALAVLTLALLTGYGLRPVLGVESSGLLAAGVFFLGTLFMPPFSGEELARLKGIVRRRADIVK